MQVVVKPLTKTAKAVAMWECGFQLDALRMFKDFRMGVSEEDRKWMQIWYEMQTGKLAFYVSLGYVQLDVRRKAIDAIERLFINPKN